MVYSFVYLFVILAAGEISLMDVLSSTPLLVLICKVLANGLPACLSSGGFECVGFFCFWWAHGLSFPVDSSTSCWSISLLAPRIASSVFISLGWLACRWSHTCVDGFSSWPVRGGHRGFSLP